MTPASLTSEQLDAILDLQGHEPCPGVEIEFERILGELPDGHSVYATIYRPSHLSSQPAPGLLAFHGGGFIAGNPNGCGEIAKTLALSLGITTVSASYRLASEGEPSYPGIFEEASLSWRWILDHAVELNIDPTRIAVSGESAGVLQAAHLAVESPLLSLDPQTHRPAALISLWGCFDYVARWFDRGQSPGAEADLLGTTYLQDPRLYHIVSPVNYATAPLPPAILVYGSQDRVVHLRQGKIAHAAWQAAGARSELKILDNIGHDTIGDTRYPREQALHAAVKFLAAHL